MNITILCNHQNSSYARDVLRALNVQGVSRINVVAALHKDPAVTWQTRWRSHGWNLLWIAVCRIAHRLAQLLRHIRHNCQAYTSSLQTEVQAQGGQYICVQDINGEESRQALREWHVDLLVLAGSPIVRSPVLAIPCLGTLNAHQGALPRFRGMNVIEWAVLEGFPPAISIHFVDPGVDTGDIIVTELIPLAPGDSFDTIRQKANTQQITLLAQTVHAALARPLPRRPQLLEEGRQYFVMHPRLRTIATQRLREAVLNLAKI